MFGDAATDAVMKSGVMEASLYPLSEQLPLLYRSTLATPLSSRLNTDADERGNERRATADQYCSDAGECSHVKQDPAIPIAFGGQAISSYSHRVTSFASLLLNTTSDY
jgi:hypothetical protein